LGKYIILILCLSAIVLNGCESKAGYKIISEGKESPAESLQAGMQNNMFNQSVNTTDEAALTNKENPFLTATEEEDAQEIGSLVPLDNLNVSAIFRRPVNSQVVINGKVLSVGDIIDNKEIFQIDADKVFLKDAQSQYILKIGETRQ